MKSKIMNIIKYSLFILIPIISALLCMMFRIAQGEKTEEIVFGIMLGMVLDFIYSLFLLPINGFINKKQ